MQYAQPGLTRGHRAWPRRLIWIGFPAAWILAVIGIVACDYEPMPAFLLSLLLAPMALVAFGCGYAARSRDRLANKVIGYIAMAVRLNVPLAEFLWAASRTERGRTAARLGDLALLVGNGMAVGAAIEHAVPEVPVRVIRKIAADEGVGRLRHGLENALEVDLAPPLAIGAGTIWVRTYPLVLLVAVLLVGSFFINFVAPKYQQIAQDLGTKLPRGTNWFFTVFGVLDGQIAGASVLVAMWGLFLLPLMQWGLHLFPSGRFFTPARWKQFLAWWTPGVALIVRSRALADVCHVLSQATGAGSPLAQAVMDAAPAAGNVVLETRVRRWAVALTGGADAGAAAGEAGMPRMMVELIRTAGKDLPAVMGFLERYYRGRFSRGVVLLRGAVEPAMVLALGVLVAFVVYAMFAPLVSYINAVALSPEVF